MELSSMLPNNALLIWTGILSIIGALFYWYVSWKQNFWSRLGLQNPKPWFLLGNVERAKEAITNLEIDWAKKYGHLYGYYLGLKPVLTVSDPELVKQILVKDFNKFVNRQKPKTYHEIMTEHLFLLEGDRWKRVRAIVTPTFTSGKLRGMQQLMNRAVDKLTNYFDSLLKNGTGTIVTKEAISGFTIDVIASTTFATETNCNDDRSKKNPFVVNGMKMFDISPLRLITLITMPKWFNLYVLGLEYLPPRKQAEFFINLTKTIVKQRKALTTGTEKRQKRSDLVQLLMEASVDENELKSTNWNKLTAVADSDPGNEKENSKSFEESNKHSNATSSSIRQLTENEIVAQCIIFFIAGFETTASTISHVLFELSWNQGIQQRLFDEIGSVLGDRETIDRLDTSTDDFFDKVINHIPYLEAVIKETLRKYPPVVRVNRRVGVPQYQLTKNLTLRQEQLIEIPIYGIHHNPEYYPKPERFDPERFMPENQHLLDPYTFIPFGTGPRNCVGMRFAYQEVKLLLAQIVPRYRFEPTAKTPAQLQFRNTGILLNAAPFELQITKRL